MMKNKDLHTIDKPGLSESDRCLDKFIYQPSLTQKLDALSGDFDQDVVNEIVLWKVNRYAGLSKFTLELLNKINSQSREMDMELTRNILAALLDSKGVKLPMASAILRFKNPEIYQIIDQRVYRFLYGKPVEYPKMPNEIIDLYLGYLCYLRHKCEEKVIPFRDADRILYVADKRLNKNVPLNNYREM